MFLSLCSVTVNSHYVSVFLTLKSQNSTIIPTIVNVSRDKQKSFTLKITIIRQSRGNVCVAEIAIKYNYVVRAFIRILAHELSKQSITLDFLFFKTYKRFTSTGAPIFHDDS